jgi:hypothetical protein
MVAMVVWLDLIPRAFLTMAFASIGDLHSR